MPLMAACPACPAPVTESGGTWGCVEHGAITPLWRPSETSYDDFTEHLARAGEFPTFVPWPLGPGWRVTDFAAVGESSAPVRGTLTCSSGTTALDGPVDVFVVAEEPGTGLGPRVAGTDGDPGAEVAHGPADARVRVGPQQVSLWSVSTSSTVPELDRSVLAGEAQGRWLWLVVRPASALLLLAGSWVLRDAGEIGPPLVEVPFEGPAPRW